MKTRVSKGGNRLYDLDGDGSIVLYTRNDVRKLVYQARLKPHGTNKVWRISTGRDKFRDAESLARRRYTVLREAVANDTVHSKKFSQILDLYLNSHKFESKPPNCRSTYALKGYIFEFFAPLEISKICEEEIRRFATWRTKNYSKRTPCDATIKREIFYLKGVLKFALEEGLIKNLPNAKFRFSRRCLPKLTFFSPQEHNKMQELILPWIREGRHGWRDRFIFSNLIGLSAFSGLRPRELGQLRYNDFFFRNDVLCCNIRSRFTQRVIEFEEEARDYIKNLRSLRTEELRHEPLNNEKILYNSRIDKSPTDTRQSLLSLLKYAEIDIEKNGARRTVSSFRNLYAYRAIKRGKADYFIANQLNVSLRTVNEYRVSFENQESTQFGLNENSSDPTHLSPINWTNF